MASNPPFQVEDQTDEDFFDNLVNDDNDDHLGSITPSKHGEGNDSDDARAFENLATEEESGGATIEALEGSTDDKFIVGGLEEGPVVAPNAVSDDGPSGASNGNSGGLDHSVIGTGKNDNCGRLSAELDAGSTNGSPSAGVKEIGWSSFYAGSAENGEHGFGSYSDFFNDLGGDSQGKAENNAETGGFDQNVVNYAENIEATQFYGSFSVDGDSRQDTSSSQHWEMYPGWKFDANTGQWYQLDGYNGSHEAGFDGSAANQGSGTDGKAEVSYLQHTVQSVGGIASTAESSSTQSTVGWNQAYKVNNGYPEHMVFDPQYPGWYYDTIAGAWQTLESYNSSVQSSALSIGNTHEQYQNEFALAGDYTQVNGYAFSEQGQSDNYSAEGLQSQSQNGGWVEDYNNYSSNNFSMWQPTSIGKTEVIPSSVGTLQLDNSFSSTFSTNNHADNHPFNSLHKHQSHDKTSHIEANGHFGPRAFFPSENLNWQLNKADSTQNEQFHFTNDFYNRQKSTSVQNSFHHIQQVPSASAVGRSSAGRPAHALVSFGFGGKLIIMKKEGSFQSSSFSSKDSIGGSISVLNLLEVVTGNTNGSADGLQTCDYFPALTQQSYPGPLAGGNVSSKELNKWIDERIANCESPDIDYQKGAVVKLLMSLLKIACQHYGKLRSPFGGDTVLKENDSPESAVARLFASAKKNGLHYSAHSQCIQQLPSDGQIRATALEVQNLLVSGRKKEALQCAQGGQLWGPALVLASQLGDQFYVETVKQMALHQLVAGSPLRTLCLLIAGQPAEVFSTETTKNITNLAAQPAQQFGTNCMLDDWEENLAVITANRTKDDELVIIHLGDCLWRERSEITAAHICYLVAESNFESYSDSARLCLVGADHWKFPRTYASPEAIQRTELYEYSKVLGNSQFTLLPFQPYKLVYAHMLAEVGKVSESLKYCQAVLKSLKTGRAPEVETWRQYVSLLEERIRIHQQSGYTVNLAPGKLVNKLRNLLDSTANLVVGGPPPHVQSFSPGSTLDGDNYVQQAGPKVSGSQSTMAMSALIPSASMEPISEWAADGNRNTMHIRSVSEPDFGRTPRQDRVDGKEAAISASQGKAHTSRGGSRFAHFGFGSQLFQKTVGLVLRPRPDKQAKLGEKNKFYYDEKLKRWVEEGAEPPAEEAALAPPPTSAFQSGTQHYNLKPASNSWSPSTNGSPKFKNPSPAEHASGIPPIPTSTNQFSARGRMGVRSRYVDTFNQGGGNHVNVFQSPAVKPAAMANAKFFVPTPVATTEESMATLESKQEENVNGETPSTSVPNNTSQSPAPPSTTMPRFPSVDNIERKENMISLSFSAAHSRRAASWSGSVSNAFTPPKLNEVKSPVEASTVPPPSFTPSPVSIGNFGEDLQEVEL